MSIIHHLPETPEDGETVYCETESGWKDRAIFEDGKFIGGGENPVPPYEMKNVKRWFSLDLYSSFHTNGYSISFEQAEKLNYKP